MRNLFLAALQSPAWICMNEEYSEYINGDVWKKKRVKRLTMSNFGCEVCGSKEDVQVHHLTYERIFKEDMKDLMPLCVTHHNAVEVAISEGKIQRTGNIRHLRCQTINLLRKSIPVKASVPIRSNIKLKNSCQGKLISESWFCDALKLARPAFKKLLRSKFEGHRNREFWMSNCFALFKRYHAKEKDPIEVDNPIPCKTTPKLMTEDGWSKEDLDRGWRNPKQV